MTNYSTYKYISQEKNNKPFRYFNKKFEKIKEIKYNYNGVRWKRNKSASKKAEESFMITYESIKRNDAIKKYITAADESLKALGYTEHSFAHVGKAADTAARILEALEYDAHTVELAKIAGYLHDIGNLVNRVEHSQSGAVMAFRILDNMGMPAEDIAAIVTALAVIYLDQKKRRQK